MVESIGSNLIQQYVNGLNVPKTSEPGVSFTESNPVSEVAPKYDSVSFLEMYARLKPNKELSYSGTVIEEGEINNKNTILKTVIAGPEHTYHQEGAIGDKRFNLDVSSEKVSGLREISYQGTYNNKNINLTLSIPQEKNIFKNFYNKTIRNKLYVPDTMTLKGEIDNVPYEITLPNSKVPKDTDERDLLMLVLSNHDYFPGIVNGKIVSIAPGENKIRGVKYKAKKRNEFFSENIKPLISQALSTALGAILAIGLAKVGLRR